MEKKHLGLAIDREVHERLVEMARSRRVPLSFLVETLLTWGAGKKPTELVELGVKLPTWPDEK